MLCNSSPPRLLPKAKGPIRTNFVGIKKIFKTLQNVQNTSVKAIKNNLTKFSCWKVKIWPPIKAEIALTQFFTHCKVFPELWQQNQYTCTSHLTHQITYIVLM